MTDYKYIDSEYNNMQYSIEKINQPIFNRIILGSMWGAIVGIVIILIWIAWGSLVYRWSIDRIKPKIMQKYESDNIEELKDKYIIQISDIKMNDLKSKVWFKIHFISIGDMEEIDAIDAVYNIYTDRDDCSFTDKTCIIV